jgi:hypothetical protein
MTPHPQADRHRRAVEDYLACAPRERLAGHARIVRAGRVLKDGTRIVFDAADVFEFAEDARIRALPIYYDSHPFRSDVRGKYT